MMNAKITAKTETRIPVQLYLGMLDGHRASVRPHTDIFDSYLFEARTKEHIYRIAYKEGGRTTSNGKRWVLVFDCIVSKQKITAHE